jgi:hypothetical protein
MYYRSSFFACRRYNPLGSATLASKYPFSMARQARPAFMDPDRQLPEALKYRPLGDLSGTCKEDSFCVHRMRKVARDCYFRFPPSRQLSFSATSFSNFSSSRSRLTLRPSGK